MRAPSPASWRLPRSRGSMLFRGRQALGRTVRQPRRDLDRLEILDRLFSPHAELHELPRPGQYAALEGSHGRIEGIDARFQRAADPAHVIAEGREPGVEVLGET